LRCASAISIPTPTVARDDVESMVIRSIEPLHLPAAQCLRGECGADYAMVRC